MPPSGLSQQGPVEDIPGSVKFDVQDLEAKDHDFLLEGYTLLQESMGPGEVEDWKEFVQSVSPSRDGTVVPKVAWASDRGEMVGFTVGMYLPELRSGLIAYSAVRPDWRRRGVYKAMRGRLVSAIRRESQEDSGGLDYIISELEGSSPLLPWYVDALGAFVAACSYEQPAVQGLRPRRLALILQPVDRSAPPGDAELTYIVEKLFERVYRMPAVATHPAFRRVAASIGQPVEAHHE